MNFRPQASSTESNETTKQAWYLQPERAQQKQAVQAPATQPAPAAALFEPSAAERILARAGGLQEVHGQMLSQEQIEAVAHEIGIKPEFVRLAIEQGVEKSSIAVQPVAVVHPQSRNLNKLRGVPTMIACALVAILYVALDKSNLSPLAANVTVSALPITLSFTLGLVARKRSDNTASGIAIASTAFVALSVIRHLQGNEMPSAGGFLMMLVFCSLATFAGAQARRIVSRRQASNRSSQTITSA